MRSKDSFRALMLSLHRSKNLQAIKLTIECNLADATLSARMRAELESLRELTATVNSLDVIHVFTAERLGLTEEAAALKATIKSKALAPEPLRRAA